MKVMPQLRRTNRESDYENDDNDDDDYDDEDEFVRCKVFVGEE